MNGLDVAALPAMDVPSRSGRVVEAFATAAPGADALLVTKLVNIRWLTGFTGSAALLLVETSGRLRLVTDGRYETQAEAQLAAAGVEADLVIGTTAAQQYAALAGWVGAGSVALEAPHVSWATATELAEQWFAQASVVAAPAVVDELRVVKDDGEIARIEAAASVATEALTRLRHVLHERPTEAEFGIELDTEMRRLGASGPSFETIVASGSNAAMPHHRPGTRTIEEGDLVILDFGAKVDGYCSDMTRTYVVGEPDERRRRILAVVGEAQAAGVAAVREGASCRAVDAVCRDRIGAEGWADAFSHGTGHGVGLEIHEAPRLAASAGVDATLVARSAVTVEPGVYLPGIGGVRIEDTVIVGADGCRPVTHAPKDPQWPSRPTT